MTKEKRFISINLHYYTFDRLGATDHNRDALLALSADTTFGEITEFSDKVKKIFKEAVKVAEQGSPWRNFSICSSHHNANRCTGVFAWSAESPDCLGVDDNGKKFIHFSPETEESDTPEWCDMCLYSDVIKSFAECPYI